MWQTANGRVRFKRTPAGLSADGLETSDSRALSRAKVESQWLIIMGYFKPRMVYLHSGLLFPATWLSRKVVSLTDVRFLKT